MVAGLHAAARDAPRRSKPTPAGPASRKCARWLSTRPRRGAPPMLVLRCHRLVDRRYAIEPPADDRRSASIAHGRRESRSLPMPLRWSHQHLADAWQRRRTLPAQLVHRSKHAACDPPQVGRLSAMPDPRAGTAARVAPPSSDSPSVSQQHVLPMPWPFAAWPHRGVACRID